MRTGVWSYNLLPMHFYDLHQQHAQLSKRLSLLQGRVPNTPYNTPAQQLKTSSAQSPLNMTDENSSLHVGT